MTKAKFILLPISTGLLPWSVNYTSIHENPELNVFKNMTFVGKISYY